MKDAVSLGLYSYSLAHPGDSGFKRFCTEALVIFAEIGLKPSFFAADGDGHKGEAVPIDGRSYKKSMSIGFDNASVVSLICNPVGSGSPAYDSFAEISLSFIEHSNETLLSLSVEETFLQAGTETSELIIDRLIRLSDWDFGYLLNHKETSNPHFYVLAADDGKLRKNEMDELLLWYNTPPALRLSKIRNAHTINFINEDQLARVGTQGKTLREIIESDKKSTLKKSFKNLWRWDIPTASVAEWKIFLKGNGLTICGG